jgi:RHS repeat-associated protein
MCRALLSRCDGLGSERAVTNASQTVTGTINYDAFGQAIGITGSSTNPYLFAATWGYRNDGDAGLMHVGARYYDAQVGRFLTRDTVLSEHPYLYCEHEPVDHVDPDGHIPILIPILIGAAIGVITVGIIDYMDDGKINRPWPHYAVGGGSGAVGGVVVGIVRGGVSIGHLLLILEKYRRGGGGLNLYHNGERIFGIDWHKWYDTAGRLHNGFQKFHIDWPPRFHHWPWQ